MKSWTDNRQTDDLKLESINNFNTGANPELFGFFNELSNSLNDKGIPFIEIIEKINNFFINNSLSSREIDDRIISNYRFAYNYVKSLNYKKALKHIKACINIIEEHNYDIDLYLLQDLLISACTYVDKYNHMVDINRNKKLFLSTNNIGLEYLYLNRLLNLENNDKYSFLLIEQLFLLNDYKSARKHLDTIAKAYNQFYYYLSFLDEKCKYGNKNDVLLTKYKISVDSLYKDGNYKEALKKCQDYFDITYDSYFIYVIGKINYELGSIDVAFDMFNKCLNIDNKYIRECYTYLCYITKKINDEKKYDIYIKESAKYYNIYDLNLTRDNFEKIIFEYSESFNDKSSYEIVKKCIFFKDIYSEHITSNHLLELKR